ncbi:cysteine-rich with EGF-like domain protein 2 isoform X2 [Triplophysa dalaica]|uniref:cysteine-rich with EGF-like domain protein 2 isoform X2 n=1 Tax=Triplophysa dalaica TaxID=1582913 RepID=UPI0024DFF934|nr:cysteine-rich with EGF-like domain protein 2 isoform X2 [Triplophysa dalaica]
MALICSVSQMFCILLALPLGSVLTKDFKALCTTCRQITQNFDKGLEKTVKQNFGGGNTAWEERKLSKYESSEIRLMEILEGLCDSSSFECNSMVEEHEEHFETWWFKRKAKHPDLFKWFCIDTNKMCCPKGSFGPDCNTCIGGLERPCHGNGKCDGDGTRDGNGRCSCDKGYEGEFCLDCSDGFFSELRNDTFSLCKECHESCVGCFGGTRNDCKDCSKGWEKDQEGACIDINECSKDPLPCKDDQYCLNTDGSFSCKACNTKCSGCIGPGADSCLTCAVGYKDEGGTCTDVNECEQSEAVCIKEHQECFNTDGSFTCQCTTGFQEQDGVCVKQQEQEENPDVPAINSEDSQTPDSPEKREDL